MAKTKRREILRSLGMMGGGVLLGAGARSLGAEGAGPATPAPAWHYRKLDPARVAERVYRIFPEGGCMYALVGGIVQSLAETEGEPYRSFPLAMMRYGEGGVGGWASICGVVNGAGAVVGLFYGDRPKEEREALINEFNSWYEATALPQYQPAKPEWAPTVPASTAQSVLCHQSVSRWCEVSEKTAFSMEKKERCRRLTVDGVLKIVGILNRALEGGKPAAALAPAVQACTACHGSKGRGDAMGKMSCAPCHKLPDPHP